MYLRESNVRSRQLDVQDTNFSFTWTVFLLWDLVIEVIHYSSLQPRARGNLLRDKLCEKTFR